MEFDINNNKYLQNLNNNIFTPQLAGITLTLPTTSTTNSNYSCVSPLPTQNKMASSTSQIFKTADAFNICPNDTVYYSRETIHLLAKFLATHGNNNIFRSLYAYAPDNLAWLWAFIDWDVDINFDKIATQEAYTPLDDKSGILDKETIETINKIVYEAPLITYKYREQIMIADVFKFIEYVQKIETIPVAKALFLLYFPRFSNYVDNPLKQYICVRILKSNISRIKFVDDMIRSLIKTRYTNLIEYNQKIITCTELPSYIHLVLNENDFYENNEQTQQNQQKIQQQQQQRQCHLQIQQRLQQQQQKQEQQHQEQSFMKANKWYNTTTNSKNTLTDYQTILQHINEYNFSTSPLSPTTANSINKKTAFSFNSNSVNGSNTNAIIKNYPSNNTTTALSLNETIISNTKSNNNSSNKQQLSDFCGFNDVNNQYNLDNIVNQNSTNQKLLSPKLNGCNNGSAGGVSNSYNTPKTPNNLVNYLSKINDDNDYCDNSDDNVWLNQTYSISPPQFKSSIQQYKLRANNLKTRTTTTASDTVTNSILASTTAKTSPTSSSSSSITNDNSVFNHDNNNNNNSININNSNNLHDLFNEDASYLIKHSAFISSPITRFTFNKKFNENASNALNASYNFNNNSYNANNTFNNGNVRHITKASNLKPYNLTNNNTSNINDVCFNQFTRTRHNSNIDSLNSNNFNFNDFYRDNNSAYLSSPNKTYASSNYFNKSTAIINNDNINNSMGMQYHSNVNTVAPQIWQGQLPPKVYPHDATYSRKVFIGGLPWDCDPTALQQHLSQKYGNVKIEIPGKDQKHPRMSTNSKAHERNTPGYVYVIYEHEASVQRMLNDCRKDIKNGGEHYIYTIFVPPQPPGILNGACNNKRGKAKEVEVIPWNQDDTSYVPEKNPSLLPPKIDSKSTIFVGALHGMLNAQGLAKVMSEVFGDVIHAGLDTDKYKYPIGSGRVTFRSRQSYKMAIKARYITIKANLTDMDPSPKFEKTIQIDPYLEEAKCSKCDTKSTLFCRSENCLDYFCHECAQNHDHEGFLISRQNKPNY